MPYRLIERATDLGEMLKVEILPGFLYEEEQAAHKFLITVWQNDAIVDVSGTVWGEFVAVDDNATYNIVGGIEGGKPYVILSPECYQTSTKCSLAIFVSTANQGTLCVYSCRGSVVHTLIGQHYDSSGLMPDVGTLIDDIEEAVASIPPNYAASFAPPYTDLTFPIAFGTYCTNNGAFYRCTTAIPASEDFTPAHWTQVSVSTEILRITPAVTGTTLVFGN